MPTTITIKDVNGVRNIDQFESKQVQPDPTLGIYISDMGNRTFISTGTWDLRFSGSDLIPTEHGVSISGNNRVTLSPGPETPKTTTGLISIVVRRIEK